MTGSSSQPPAGPSSTPISPPGRHPSPAPARTTCGLPRNGTLSSAGGGAPPPPPSRTTPPRIPPPPPSPEQPAPAGLRRRLAPDGARILSSGAATMDEDWLHVFAAGMPPAGGLSIGLERLLLTVPGPADLRDVIPFPLAP